MSEVFSHLSPQSKVWLYQSSRELTPSETIEIKNKIKDFTAQWHSHREAVTAAADLLYSRFVVLMADEEQVGVSGCSIDSSVKFIKELEATYSTHFFDRLYITYKNGEEIIGCTQDEFLQKVVADEISEDTLVFNNLIQTKQDWEKNWVIPFGKSWMKRFFKKESLV